MELSLIIFIAVIIGFILDSVLGDPIWIPHPIVGFGKAISYFENRFNSGAHKKRNGALITIFLVIGTFVLFYGIALLALQNKWVFGVFTAIFLFLGLANHTLLKEVWMVEKALGKGLDEGRKQVQRIVGRDTSQLNEQQIRKAALETLAENLSDGVVAPLFYFAILGIPGMFMYKMVNTLDSMIGYKSDRYKDFGFFAAKLDDAFNFIPARITAVLMALAGMSFRAFKFIFKYGNKHASPNAGYPEAALAGILNCQFGGPNVYFNQLLDKPYIGINTREINSNDTKVAFWINIGVSIISIGIILGILYLKLPF